MFLPIELPQYPLASSTPVVRSEPPSFNPIPHLSLTPSTTRAAIKPRFSPLSSTYNSLLLGHGHRPPAGGGGAGAAVPVQDRQNAGRGLVQRSQGVCTHRNRPLLCRQGYQQAPYGWARTHGAQRDRRVEACVHGPPEYPDPRGLLRDHE